jgi:hypothetical protein
MRPGRAAVAAAAAVLVAAAVLGAGAGAGPGDAGPAIMPSHAIAVGMTGIGKTVIIGTAVVPFNVRVLGILHNAGPAGDLVLFRASGAAIQSVGGIAAGMSGSPVYLQGKLAGALAYTFQASDPTVGLFTPIEDMLRLLPAGSAARPWAASRAYAVPPFSLGGRTIRRVVVPGWGAADGGGRDYRFGLRCLADAPGRASCGGTGRERDHRFGLRCLADAPGRASCGGTGRERDHRFGLRCLADAPGRASCGGTGRERIRALRPAADTLVAAPAATPLFVSGVGGTGLEALTQLLAPMGLSPTAGGSEADVPASLPLEPGSAIGVALIKGDIAAYAIGTMTYRDGDRILAFGHPFTGIGPANYLLMNATIFQVVKGQQQNIKVGAAGAPVGIISQDRPAGIGGTIGVMPRMFGVRVRVTDEDTGHERNFNFQVIPSPEIAPAVVPVGAQAAIERALNRSGEGTATVRMVLHGRNLPAPVVRENMFYAPAAVSARALSELPQAMSLLFNNDFTDAGPTSIDLDVHVTSAERTATIVEAEGPHDPVAPGDTLHVRVTVRRFRGAAETHDIALTIPQNAVSGPAMLVVRAGGSGVPAAAAAAAVQAAQGVAPRTLADAVKAFENGDKNTDVVVELMGGVPPHTTPGVATPAAPSKTSAGWTTPWVMRGRLQVPVVIKGGTH